jgi:hypothetical protein
MPGEINQGKPWAKLSCPLRGGAYTLCAVHREQLVFLRINVDVEATLAIRHRLEAYATLTPSRGGCWFVDLPVGVLETSLHAPED